MNKAQEQIIISELADAYEIRMAAEELPLTVSHMSDDEYGYYLWAHHTINLLERICQVGNPALMKEARKLAKSREGLLGRQILQAGQLW